VPLPDSDEWLLTPVSVWEVLDDLPEVARKPKFQDAKQVRNPELTGFPVYSLSWSKNDKAIQINISVFLKGEAKGSQISNLEQRILKNLRQMNRPLAYYMDLGMVQLQVQFNTNLELVDNILDIWM
jgi:hypothetical protein